MQAIETYYLGATNFKPARIVAKSQAGKVVVSWDSALDVEENHHVAAKALAAKLKWFGLWASGGNSDGSGNVYVCIERYKSMIGVDIKSTFLSAWR